MMATLLHALLTVQLASAAPAAVPPPPASAAQEETRPKDVESYLQACAAQGWAGAALVVRKGKVLYEGGFGDADRDAGTANGPEVLYELASLTKPLTAMAVLALYEEGKVDLDASIAEYLPGVPEARRGITVRDLLCHSSGMPRAATGGRGEDLAAAVAGYFATPAKQAPAVAAEYWNGGYALLAGIVQEVSGMSYADYCRERLYARAGIEGAGFTGDALDPAQQAVGYDGALAVRRAAEHPYGSYGWQYQGMGGAVMSPRQLLQLLDAYEDGKLLAPATVALMETEVRGSYGLGWAVTKTQDGHRRVAHGGDVRGFHVQLMRCPEEEVSIILMSNVEGVPMWKLAWNVEALLFELPMRTPPPPAVHARTAKRLKELLGTWAAEDGSRIEVLADGAHRVRVRALDADAEDKGSADEGSDVLAGRLFDAVIQGDRDLLAEHLGAGIPESWPDTLCSRIWPAHLESHGAYLGRRLLSVRALAGGAQEFLYALDHEQEDGGLRIVLAGERLRIFDLRVEADPSAGGVLHGAAEGALLHFDWSSDQVSGGYLLEGRGRSTRLIRAGADGSKGQSFKPER